MCMHPVYVRKALIYTHGNILCTYIHITETILDYRSTTIFALQNEKKALEDNRQQRRRIYIKTAVRTAVLLYDTTAKPPP